MREYPKVLKSWKEGFSAYQANTKKNKNAEKTARAAVDIVLNYILCDNKDVYLKLISDRKILNEMLILFQERRFIL